VAPAFRRERAVALRQIIGRVVCAV
jgi:hypothetical protein